MKLTLQPWAETVFVRIEFDTSTPERNAMKWQHRHRMEKWLRENMPPENVGTRHVKSRYEWVTAMEEVRGIFFENEGDAMMFIMTFSG